MKFVQIKKNPSPIYRIPKQDTTRVGKDRADKQWVLTFAGAGGSSPL